MFNCWGEGSVEGYGIMTDHAAMNETSLEMAMYPELVQMKNLPSDSTKWPLGVSGKAPGNLPVVRSESSLSMSKKRGWERY